MIAAGRDNLSAAVKCDSARRHRMSGNRRAQMKPARLNTLFGIRQQARFITIKMRGTCNVEQQRIVPCYSHERRIALRCIGECRKQCAISIRIRFMNSEVGLQCARSGECHPGHQPERAGRLIACHHHNAAALPRNDDVRRVIRRGGRA